MLSALLVVFNFVAQHPQMANNAMAQLEAPGAVNQAELGGAIADVARQVLACYHKTARLESIQDTASQFLDAPQYGADGSDVILIRYRGMTGIPYAMLVALMTRGDSSSGELRAAVLRDNAIVPYARGCLLQDWTPVS